MLQLMYNEHTCNHATCSHFHHSPWDTFATSFLTMNPIDTISTATNVLVLLFNYTMIIIQLLII
jgi:hypothetical protein